VYVDPNDEWVRGIVSRLEAGCDEAEFNRFRCPVCGSALNLSVDAAIAAALVFCSGNLGDFRPSQARVTTMPDWWKAHEVNLDFDLW
jgi:hypothetical protein